MATLHDGEVEDHIKHPHYGDICMVPGWHPHQHEPSTDPDDVQAKCDHVWPSDLDFNEGRCEQCDLPYAEWSAR